MPQDPPKKIVSTTWSTYFWRLTVSTLLWIR